MSKLQRGPARLAQRLRELRHSRALSQKQLAERATTLHPSGISVETIRKLENVKNARALPRRRPAREAYALESTAKALDIDIAVLLLECFSREQLLESTFSWVVEQHRERERIFASVLDSGSLGDFVASLPRDVESLLALSGLLTFKNAEAFAYIFALERELAGLEMLVLNEPAIILLDDEDIERRALGMQLDGDDSQTFLTLVHEHQAHSRSLVESGDKRYQAVLNKDPLVRFLKSKTPDAGIAQVQDVLALIRCCPRFELVLLDAEPRPDEFEVISRYQSIPTTLEDTVSVVIRPTSMSAARVEYSLIPMPPSLSGLQRDIARIEEAWSIALDQYSSYGRATLGAFYHHDPSELTSDLLIEIAKELWFVDLS